MLPEQLGLSSLLSLFGSIRSKLKECTNVESSAAKLCSERVWRERERESRLTSSIRRGLTLQNIQLLLEGRRNGGATLAQRALDILHDCQHGLKPGDLRGRVRAGGEGSGQAESVSSLDGGGQLAEVVVSLGWAVATDLLLCDGRDAVSGTVGALAGNDAEVRDEGGDGGCVSGGSWGLRSSGDGESQDGCEENGRELHGD